MKLKVILVIKKLWNGASTVRSRNFKKNWICQQVNPILYVAMGFCNLISDPEEWAVEHVQIWLQWAVRHFNLVRIQLANWSINGRELFAMKRDQFKDKVPVDQNDIFWTHLELLRKCKFVGKRLKSKQKNCQFFVLLTNLVAEISQIFLLCKARG